MAVVASGGTETTVGGYKIHTFTSGGNFVVTTGGEVEYLVVGGGGGGGYFGSGGGGAGRVRPGFLTVSAQTYPITVGAGGNGATGSSVSSASKGASGDSSTFDTVTSVGGGGGGSYGNTYRNGVDGACGGGAGYGSTAPDGSGTPGASTVSLYGGGTATYDGATYLLGGGGGGNIEAGANATTSAAGDGGDGISSDISGTIKYYGGGGGGGAFGQSGIPVTNGAGGLGGGGNGGRFIDNELAVQNGTANTGGGGGGSAKYSTNESGGNGGSGIVIIRYLLLDPPVIHHNHVWVKSISRAEVKVSRESMVSTVDNAPDDAAKDGTIRIDTANNYLWFRSNGTWKRATIIPTSPNTYTVTNLTTDRIYDANATTLNELADIVGNLIVDLRETGIIV